MKTGKLHSNGQSFSLTLTEAKTSITCFALAVVLLTGCERKSEEHSKVSFQLPLDQITFTKAVTRKLEPSKAESGKPKKSEVKKSSKTNKLNKAPQLDKSAQKQNVTSADSALTKTELHTFTANPENIVLSITGPDLAPVLCHFEVRSGIEVSGPCRPTKSDGTGIEVDVKAGPSRLVQILVAYKTVEGDSAPVIKYGDTTPLIDMKPGDVPVTIQLETIASGVSFGHISGRFLTSPNAGPNGLLTASVKVRADKPAMTLMRSEVYGGWFHAVATNGMKTEYLVNGVNIFGKPMDKAEFQALLANQGASPKFSLQDFSDGFEVRGWFGPQANLAGKTIAETCSPVSSRYESCLDENAYFSGPFARHSSGGFLAKSGNTVSWQYLPGATAGMDGVKVLFNSNFGDRKSRFQIERGQYDCQFMNDQSDTVSQFIAMPGSSINLTQNLFADGHDPANFQYAVCPVRNGKLMRSAVVEPSDDNDQGGGPEDSLRLEIAGANHVNNGDQEIARDQCYEAKIRAYHWDGSRADPVPVPNQLNLNLTPWPNANLFSSAAACDAGTPFLSSSINIAASASESSSFWIKASVVENAKSLSISGHESSPFHYSGDHNRVNVKAAVPVGYLRIEPDDGDMTSNVMDGEYKMLTRNYCHPFKIVSYSNANYSPLAVTSELNITSLAGQSGSGLNFFSDSGCDNSISGVSIPSGQTETSVFYIKGSSNGSGKLVTMNIPEDGLRSFDAPSNEFRVADARLVLDAPTSVLSGYCYKLRLSALLANGEFYEQPSDLPFDFGFGSTSGDNAQIYGSLGDCVSSSNPISSKNIPSALADLEFYAKTSLNSGPISITASETSGSLDLLQATIANVAVAASGSFIATKVHLNHPSTFTTGVCNPVRMKMTNDTGSEVRPGYPVQFTVRNLTPYIALYQDPDCQLRFYDGSEIFVGDDETYSEFYAMATVAGQSGLNLAHVNSMPFSFFPGPTVSTANPAAGGLALSFNSSDLPDFSIDSIVGTHEFGNQRAIQILPFGSTYVHCEEMLPNNPSSRAPCTADIFVNSSGTYTLNWKKEKAIEGKVYRFYAMNGLNRTMLELDPRNLYGNDFEVVDCGGNVISASTIASADLIAALAPSSTPSTVCIGPGVTLTCNQTINITSASKRIIGWSSSRTIIEDSGLSAAACIRVTSANDNAADVVLANLDFNLDNTSSCGGYFYGISLVDSTPTNGPRNLVVRNSSLNIFPRSVCTAKGIQVSANNDKVGLKLMHTGFYIDRATGSSAAISLSNSHEGSIEMDDIIVIGSSGGSNTASFIHSTSETPGTTPSYLSAKHIDLSGPNTAFISGNDTATESMIALDLIRSKITPGASSAGNPIFSLTSASSGQNHFLTQNRFEFQFADPSSAFMKLREANGDGIIVSMSQNTFFHSGSRGNVVVASSAGPTHYLKMNANSFKTGSTDDLAFHGEGLVFSETGSPRFELETDLPIDGGLNRICDVTSVSPSYGWNGNLINNVVDNSSNPMSLTQTKLLANFSNDTSPGSMPSGNFCP